MVYKTFKTKAKKPLLEGKNLKEKYARLYRIDEIEVEKRRKNELGKALKELHSKGHIFIHRMKIDDVAKYIEEGITPLSSVDKKRRINDVKALNRELIGAYNKNKVILIETREGKIVVFGTIPEKWK